MLYREEAHPHIKVERPMRVEIKDDNIMHTLSTHPERWEIFVDDVLIKLTFKEYFLFKILGSSVGTMVSKEYITMSLYGALKPAMFDNLRVVACRLRQKISAASGGRIYVLNAKNAGYMLA